MMDQCDAVWFLSYDLRMISESGGFGNERIRASSGNGRVLFTEGKPAFAVKNRLGMPEKIPLPIDFDFSELARFWA